MSIEIVTVGEILVEIMATEVNQSFKQAGKLVGPFPSGAPAIFADSAAKIGGKVGIVSSVGNDDFASLCTNRLKSDGVDVSSVKTYDNKTTGTAFVTYFDSGERQFIFHFSDSAAGYITITENDEEYISSAKYFHIMGCSVTASEANTKAINKSLDIAQKNGLKISFDPNLRKELLQNAQTAKAVNDIVNKAHIFLTGVEELKWITGESTVDLATNSLFNKNAEVIVVKNGKKPVTLYTKNKDVIICESEDYGEFVDATGAGDCFDGAFIACLSKGFDYEKALKVATVAGSLSVTKKGPMEGTVYLNEVEAILNRN